MAVVLTCMMVNDKIRGVRIGSSYLDVAVLKTLGEGWHNVVFMLLLDDGGRSREYAECQLTLAGIL